MSHPALPDDPAEWPKNPAELLGVEPGADARELRRAYTRLIRVYKPEQEPEKFQRIRAAYELLLRMAELGVSFSTPQTVERDDAERVTTDPVQSSPSRVAEPKSKIDVAWDAACEGRIAEAYRQLRELLSTGHDAETTYLRLYWLARLHPQLDDNEHPARWLVRGIRRHGLTDRLGQTYVAEVILDPAEALSKRCEEALAASGSLQYRFALLHARWEAASRSGRWKVVQNDLNTQRGRMMDEPAGTLPRMMFAAFTYVCWIEDDGAARFADALRGNLQKTEEIDASFDSEYNRFELLCEIVATLPRAGVFAPKRLVKLVREAWIADHDRIRLLFQQQAALWVPKVEEALSELDALVTASPASVAFLTHVASAIAQPTVSTNGMEESLHRRRFSEHLALRLSEATQQRPRYRPDALRARMRAEVARTCFDEVLAFDDGLDDQAHMRLPPEIIAAVANDLPLRCLVEFGRLLYASA